MAVTAADLAGMDFEVTPERKPEKSGGVTVSTIPESLVKLLTEHAPKALQDKDYELILRVPVRYTPVEVPEKGPEKAAAEKTNADAKAEAEKTAEQAVKLLTSYATAWGKGQEPKLYIHKVPNRKDMPASHARLAVELDSEVTADNRPGRRSGR